MEEALTLGNYSRVGWGAYARARTEQTRDWEKTLPKIRAEMLVKAQQGSGVKAAALKEAAQRLAQSQDTQKLGPTVTSLVLAIQVVTVNGASFSPIETSDSLGGQINSYEAAIKFLEGQQQLRRLDNGQNPLELVGNLSQPRRFLVMQKAATRWYDYLIFLHTHPEESKFVLAYEPTEQRSLLYPADYFLSLIIGAQTPSGHNFSLCEALSTQ